MMIHTFTPTLTHIKTPNGSEMLLTGSEYGSVSGHISDSDVISIEQITVDEEHRRNGIGTFLLQSTIRGAHDISDRHIRYVDFAVTNPHSIRLLRKLFGESIQYFASEQDRDTKTDPIDSIFAGILTTIRQEQARVFEETNQELPSDFDPGVVAIARLHPEIVESWPMPNIVEGVVPYWD